MSAQVAELGDLNLDSPSPPALGAGGPAERANRGDDAGVPVAGAGSGRNGIRVAAGEGLPPCVSFLGGPEVLSAGVAVARIRAHEA
jgi:hypothetical protein